MGPIENRKKQEDGESYMRTNFIIFTLHQIREFKEPVVLMGKMRNVLACVTVKVCNMLFYKLHRYFMY